MLKNYLKIAVRTLLRHKGYTFINVTGLAVGMACCLLILLFVRDEVSYDRFHDKADRIYRIVSDWGNFTIPSTNPPVLARLGPDFPEVTIAPMLRNGSLVSYEEERFSEEHIYFTRPSFFEVFSFNIQQGNPETVLTQPFTALITPETADKYFGDIDPVGKTLRFDNQFDVEVVGLVEAAPENAHFQYDFLVSWVTLDVLFDYSNSMSFGNNSIYTYLLFPDGYDPSTFEAQLPDFIERHAGDNWNGSTLSLQALTDIHLRSHLNMELGTNSDIGYVYIFSIIALFILLVACVNFMNLATARSAERAKEVGVRKVMGAQRGQLTQQFLAESIVLSFLSLILAVILTVVALPAFRALSGKSMLVDVLGDGFTLGAFLLITLLVGILAGSYPAFVLSSFKPIVVLKGGTPRSKGALLRKGLVVFQFATSICLLVGTFIVYNQLEYLRQANLGFDKDQVVIIPTQDQSVVQQYVPFKAALNQNSNILDVAVASEGLPSELLNGNGTVWEGVDFNDRDNVVPTRTVSVGHDFFETLGVDMVAGRTFSLDFAADSGAYILNETAAQMLLRTSPDPLSSLDEAIGRTIQLGNRTGQLVGISEDFNMSSLHEAIEPIIFFFNPNWYDHYLIRVAPGELTATMDFVRDTWGEFYPEWPYAFNFADAAFDAQYRAEDRLGQIFTVFSLLAIFIACLGLFGLASFTAQQRTKEIGVRKVMGASVPSIVRLLSREFTILVGVAFIVAAPLSFFAMNTWLEGFAYQIQISWMVFVLAGLSALMIAWLTVSYQSIRAATANPVDALRYE